MESQVGSQISLAHLGRLNVGLFSTSADVYQGEI